jgi:putative membrane protein
MWSDFWPMPYFFPLFPILMIAACAVVMLMMMRGMRGGMHRGGNSALEILNQRFARGDINKTEYDERRRVLEG